jgi:hypothetical protein
MNYAIIQNNIVVNVALSDAALADNWIASNTAAIGDRYENGEFIKPVVPEPEAEAEPTPTKEQLMAELAALTAKIQALE